MRKWVGIFFIFLFSLYACRSPKNTSSSHSETTKYQSYSTKLGVPVDKQDNEALIKEIISWLGTPYRDGACNKSGTDCSGFVKEVYKTVYSIELKRNSADMYESSKHISKSSLKQGDLVFFKLNGGKKVSHVGIFIKDNKFAHASSTKGVMISDLTEPYFEKGYLGAGRVL